MVVEQIGPRRARLRHLFAAAEGAHHLPERPDRRQGRRPDLRPAAVPGVREPDQGHLVLHQLAGRRGDVGPGDLRHHAVHPPARSRPLVFGQAASMGSLLLMAGAEGQALRAAELAHHDPPALGRRPGPGDRHRDPGARDPSTRARLNEIYVTPHRPADRGDRAGDGARQVLVAAGGQGVRPDRRGGREPADADRSRRAAS